MILIILLLAGGIIYATFASNPMSYDDLIELRFLPSRRRHRDPERPERTHADRPSIALCQQQLSAWRMVIGQFFSDRRRMRRRLIDPKLSGMPLDGSGRSGSRTSRAAARTDHAPRISRRLVVGSQDEIRNRVAGDSQNG